MQGSGGFLYAAFLALGALVSIEPMIGPRLFYLGSRTPARRGRRSYPMPSARRFIRRDTTRRMRQRRHRQARRTSALRRRRQLRLVA